ncbi:MAG: 2-C-methyl-D-erythritol 2,4-cyclodiphosphate synthase [Bacilli bacterium]|nr:2-C-methyl-D-erythritol 2,4-cyclodiphosphate synthase [Bacilli bacterium]MBO4682489.1 2-C-methyl-D-erythritol 2,4-cyclodiphosphate synthase [Bacilli bacterium]
MIRMGFSKDIHRLVENRKLMLGGIHVPFELGEAAHSDGDVVYHAVAESILGALALGDLGKHFPDNDKNTENMDSALIMKSVYQMMDERGYRLNNLDVFISLERPKLKDYIETMRKNIAGLLNADLSAISIKAGTNEKMGPVGEGKAVEAYAVVTLESK